MVMIMSMMLKKINNTLRKSSKNFIVFLINIVAPPRLELGITA